MIPGEPLVLNTRCLEKLRKHDKSEFTQRELNHMIYMLEKFEIMGYTSPFSRNSE